MAEQTLPRLTPGAITALHEDKFQTNAAGVQEPIVVQVTAILRYLCDRAWLALTRLPLAPNQEYVYDVIVNDGLHRAKCVMHPQLANALFHRNLLSCFAIVRITKWVSIPLPLSKRSSEKSTFAVIEGLEVIEPELNGIVSYAFDNDVPLLPPFDSEDLNEDPKAALRPFIGMRGFYLHQFADDVPFDTRWSEVEQHKRRQREITRVRAEGDLNIFQSYPTFADVFLDEIEEWLPLATLWEKFAPAEGFKQRTVVDEFLVVRVMMKGHLNSFGKVDEERGKKYPLTFKIQVADGTSRINVVFWDGLCALFYGRIQVKLNYEDAKKIEVHCNVSYPASKILILAGPSTVPQELQLPAVPLNVIAEFAELSNLPDSTPSVSLVGVVVAVFDPFVFLTSQQTEKFFMARWVVLLDEASSMEVPVKIFISCEHTLFEKIKIGDLLLITECRLRNIKATDPNVAHSLMFAESSYYSHIYRNKNLLRFQHPHIESLVSFSLALDLAPYISLELSLPIFRNFYMHCPSLMAYTTKLFGSTEHHAVPLSEVPQRLKHLRFAERQSFLVHAHLRRIEFVKETLGLPTYRLDLVDLKKQSPMAVFLPTYSLLRPSINGEIDVINAYESKERVRNLVDFLPNEFVTQYRRRLFATSDETKILRALNELLPTIPLTLTVDIFCRTSFDDGTEVVVTGIFAYDEQLGVQSAEESEEDRMDVDIVHVS